MGKYNQLHAEIIKRRHAPFIINYSIIPEKEKEKIRKRASLYHKKNFEKCNSNSKKWNKENRQKCRDYQKKSYEKEKLYGKRKARSWVDKNKEKILRIKGEKCEECKSVVTLEIHHKKYVNNLKDLQVLCLDCHNKIHRIRDDNGNRIVAFNI